MIYSMIKYFRGQEILLWTLHRGSSGLLVWGSRMPMFTTQKMERLGDGVFEIFLGINRLSALEFLKSFVEICLMPSFVC